MGLADCRPRAVAVTLGGARFKALALRFKDLATLEALAAEMEIYPGDGLEPPSGDADRAPYRSVLRAAYDAALAWPPDSSSPAFVRTLASVRGAAELLYAVLRSHRPRPTRAECRDLASVATAAEWARVERVAWGAHPFHSLSRLVDIEAGIVEAPPASDSGGWSAALAALARMHKARPGSFEFRRLLGMTLPEASWWLSGGDRPQLADALVAAGSEACKLRERFWAEKAPAGG